VSQSGPQRSAGPGCLMLIVLVVVVLVKLGFIDLGEYVPDVPAWPNGGAEPPPPGADPTVARTICRVARELRANDKVILSAYEAAIVESGVRNLPYGDRDSLGVFQQRPSQGWGTPKQILDPAYAARQYISRAIRSDSRNPDLTPGHLAQSVQNSAYPDRYDRREGQARGLIAQYCS
jgi:hypothetical protein